jgi:hypothetical protein
VSAPSRNDEIEQLIAQRTPPAARFITGEVCSVDSAGNVTVALAGGGQRAVARLVDTSVQLGDPVLLLRDGNLLTVVGPISAVNLPVTGTVASVPPSGYSLVVDTPTGPVTALFPASYNPTVGDFVLLIWQGSVAIAFKRGASGSPSGDDFTVGPGFTRPPGSNVGDFTPQGDGQVDAAGGAASGSNVFPATGSGTRRDGTWCGDVDGRVVAGTGPSGGANTGAWFTSNNPMHELAGATVTAAWIWLARDTGAADGPQTVHLYRVTDPDPGDADLTFTADTVDAVLDVGDAGWYELPADLAQNLVDDGGSIAVQAPDGPYVRLQGLPQSGQAGALKIEWSRT